MQTIQVGEKWRLCDRCGFQFPLSHLVINDRGEYICTDHCWDENEDSPKNTGKEGKSIIQ